MDQLYVNDDVNREINTHVECLRNLDSYSQKINSIRSQQTRIVKPRSIGAQHAGLEKRDLREQMFPVTLGEAPKYHIDLFIPTVERLTFSPPAFGVAERPGDRFKPWQCVLAVEAPAIASTVYRHVLDCEDFNNTIDETGQIHPTEGTTSERRFAPKNRPPIALDYLKFGARTLCSTEPHVENRRNQFPVHNAVMESAWPIGDSQQVRSDAAILEPPLRREPIHYGNLINSPIQSALSEIRLKRFQLEETMLRHAERLDEFEEERGPVPQWYSLKTPQFFYEARKHNRQLMAHGCRS